MYAGKTCGHAGIMEFNGDVYSCDHYVFPEYKLGNIRTHSLTEMMYSPKQLKFGADKAIRCPISVNRANTFLPATGMPKNRFLTTADGEPGLNYLCKGLKILHTYCALHGFHEKELMAQRPPANVMEWARKQKQ